MELISSIVSTYGFGMMHFVPTNESDGAVTAIVHRDLLQGLGRVLHDRDFNILASLIEGQCPLGSLVGQAIANLRQQAIGVLVHHTNTDLLVYGLGLGPFSSRSG